MRLGFRDDRWAGIDKKRRYENDRGGGETDS